MLPQPPSARPMQWLAAPRTDYQSRPVNSWLTRACTVAERRRGSACVERLVTSAGGSSGCTPIQTRRTFRPEAPRPVSVQMRQYPLLKFHQISAKSACAGTVAVRPSVNAPIAKRIFFIAIAPVSRPSAAAESLPGAVQGSFAILQGNSWLRKLRRVRRRIIFCTVPGSTRRNASAATTLCLIVLTVVVLGAGSALAAMNHAKLAPTSDIRHHAKTGRS